jgi:RHS repeat-associated protein
MRKLLVILCLFWSTSLLFGHNNDFVTFIQGTQIVQNATLDNEDDRYTYMLTTPNWVNEFTNVALPKNRVWLKYTGAEKKVYSLPWWIEVDVTIEKWDQTGAPLPSETATVKLNYSPSSNTSFEDINVFETTGGFKTKISITAVRKSNSLPFVPNDIILENEISIDRYYILNPNTGTTLNHSLSATTNSFTFYWDFIPGAEEYDLEWLFVSSYEENANNFPTTVSSKLFDKASRITTGNQFFTIGNVFDDGIVYYRVRAVGKKTPAFSQRFEGNWIGNISTNKFTVVNLDDFKNWKYSATYAEQGKNKEVVEYFDGTSRSRQAVTITSTEQTAIISESIYDYEGRPAIQTLPAPDAVFSNTLKYHEQFSLNQQGLSYSKKNFDNDNLYNANCNLGLTPPFSSAAGAGNYYSPSNSLKQEMYNAYVPNSNGYPFTQTVYNVRGEVASQSAPGINHTVGSTHETKYYGATPTQTKLDQLFGNEVGYYQHYKQNAVVDANGQTSISFVDLSGNVIATQLTGENPIALDPLTSNTASSQTQESFVSQFEPDADCYVVKQNYFVANAGTVQAPNPYVFTYTLTKEDFDALCASLHKDCVYDLSINIFDECNAPLASTSYTVQSGNLHLHSGITNILGLQFTVDANAFNNGPIDFDFTVNFPKIGTYYIEKKLCLNQDALNAALADFQHELETNPNQTCYNQSLTDIEIIYQQELSSSDCFPSGTQCEVDCQTQATTQGFLPNSVEWYSYVTNCMQESCNASSVTLADFDCSELYNVLKSDMSPNGQYFDNITYNAFSAVPLNATSPTPTVPPTSNYIGEIINDMGGLTIFRSDFFNFCVQNSCPLPPSYTTSTAWLSNAIAWQEIRDNWQECYGDYFVKFHPEYCRYRRCQDLSSSTFYDFSLLSHNYNWATNTQHYNNNNWQNLFTSDPAYSMPWFAAFMTANYTSTLWNDATTQAIQMYGNVPPPTNDQIWKVLATSYINKKKQVTSQYPCTEICSGTSSIDPNNPNDPQGPRLTNCSNYPNIVVSQDGTTIYNINASSNGNGFIVRDPEIYDDLTVTTNLTETSFNQLEEHYSLCNTPASTQMVACYNNNTFREIQIGFDCGFLDLNVYIPSLGYISLIGPSVNSTIPNSAFCPSSCSFMSQQVANAINNWHPTNPNEPDFTAIANPNQSGVVTIYAPTSLGSVPNYNQSNALNFILESTGFNINPTPSHLTPPLVSGPNPLGAFNNGITQECDISSPTCFCQTLKSIQDAYSMQNSSGQFLIPQEVLVGYSNMQEYTVYTLNQTLIGLNLVPSITFAQVQTWRSECLLINTLPQTNAYLTASPVLTGLPSALNCDEPESCIGDAEDIADYNTEHLIDEMYQQASEDFVNAYRAQCFKSILEGGTFSESFSVVYNDKVYHTTLYYYDQANNLTRTIPPNGVAFLSGTALANVQNHRVNPTLFPNAVYPNNKLSNNTWVTNYKYNTYNNMVESKTPDGGQTQYWYNKVGLLRFSQNDKQENTISCTNCLPNYKGAYSYTIYDNQARIIEVGESDEFFFDDPQLTSPFYGMIESNEFPYSGKQVTKTYYDNPIASNTVGALFANGNQQNLRKRVVATTFEEVEDGDDNTYNSASYYSYSIHGQVDELIQDNTSLAAIGQQYKKITYDYDLISGKVNEVAYQENEKDQFYHRYYYDADNRITNVYTSKDKVIWDKDARYFYHLHGPMARTEIGDDKVQAMDYAYTINGWLKTVNANTLERDRDMGSDGVDDYTYPVGSNGVYATQQKGIHSNVAADAFGFTLNYFNGDYSAINTSVNTTGAPHNFLMDISSLNTSTADLFNGNIKEMATAMYKPNFGSAPSKMQYIVNKYKYDQLNRIKEMNPLFYDDNGFAGAANPNGDYHEAYTYDANGNIITLQRKAYTGPTNGISHSNTMDQLTYMYETGRNRLSDVSDAGNNAAIDFNDFKGAVGYPIPNYTYDEIGNMTGDYSEEILWIDGVKWSVYGKILEIKRRPNSAKPDLEFKYDAAGNRIVKIVKPRIAGNDDPQPSNEWTYTYYVRDATGNVMATYTKKEVSATTQFTLDEQHLYGSNRMGVHYTNVDMLAAVTTSHYFTRTKGNKIYEGTNHLGNVLVTYSDIKLGVQSSTSSSVEYYLADLRSASDYYPFGSSMPGRHFSATNQYRYGFENQEQDQELWDGAVSFKYRIEDQRLGRFFSIDPLEREFPFYSSYQFCANSPIMAIELEGLESSNNPNLSEQHSWKYSNGGDSPGTPLDYAKAFGNGIADIGWNALSAFESMKESFPEFMADPWKFVKHDFEHRNKNWSQYESPHLKGKLEDLKDDPIGELNTFASTLTTPNGVKNITSFAFGMAFGSKPQPKLSFGLQIGSPFSKIIGTAQKTGTFGHAATSKFWAYRYAFDPRVESVTLNLGYKRLGLSSQIGFKYGPRPDIGVKFKNGTGLGIEIMSKTDIYTKLKYRNLDFFNKYKIDANVKVKKPLKVFKYLKTN